jgi:alcohol dehydrogenase (NADP+)
MNRAKAFAATSATSPFASIMIPRRDLTERHVEIEILFCGVCHSDVHVVRNEWSHAMPTVYPVVPGHEIVGRVTRVGSGGGKYKAGDLVGVGCLVGSDGSCDACKAGLEQYCPNQTQTYGSPDRHLGGVTYGGYSERIVVDEHFVLRVPETLDPAGAAPLLCAGITTYSPLRHWGVGSGKKVGVIGLAASATWPSNSPTPSAPTSWCSRHRLASKRMPSDSGPMRSSIGFKTSTGIRIVPSAAGSSGPPIDGAAGTSTMSEYRCN